MTARALFVWVCAVAPSTLLAAAPIVRAALLALLVVVVLTLRRRLRWARTAVFFGAVVVFNLATPGGRILFQLFGFPFTAGALDVGLSKALGLTSLLLLSKIGIRPDLELPGRWGRVLNLTLAYVRYLLDADVRLLARDPVRRLDDLLREVERNVDVTPRDVEVRSTIPGLAVLGGSLAVHWTVVLVAG